MTTFTHISTSPLLYALGWTLLHFFWQGAGVAVLLACVLALLPSRASQARYAAACGAMAAMLVLPLATFIVLAIGTLRTLTAFVVATGEASYGTALLVPVQLQEPWTEICEHALNRSLPFVIAFWLTGVLFLLARLNVGLLITRKLKYEEVEPVSLDLLNTMQLLRRRLGVDRAVKLLHSARVQSPVVIGWLRPIILFPVGCAAGLSSVQVEAILAHELAHIRRSDYLVSLAQSLAEAVLFYHPAVWWVSNRIRCEREHCCDDIAVEVSGDRLNYARALSRMEELRAPTLGALAATGGGLKTRVERLLGLKQEPALPRAVAVILLVLVAMSGLVAWHAAHAQTAIQQAKRIDGPNGHFSIWLNHDVRWIITPEERQAFRHLTNNEERAEFVRQFWERRNPNPGSTDNAFKKEHYRRLAYADTHFAWKQEPGSETDRGHVYIVFGPPDSIEAYPHGTAELANAHETWSYRSIRFAAPLKPDSKGLGEAAQAVVRKNVDFRFVDECACGQYQLKSAWPAEAAVTMPEPAPGSSLAKAPNQPDLSCTYYYRNNNSAVGTCETLSGHDGHYYCAANENKNLVEEQVGCEWKIKRAQSEAQHTSDGRVQVRSLRILSSDLPENVAAQIAHAYQGNAYTLQELSQRIRQQVRDLGYAKAQVQVQNLDALRASPPARPADITVQVSAGAQYRIDRIQIEGNRSISSRKILDQFPLHPGDLFNATEVGKGLDGLRTMYVAKGFTQVALIPALQMNDALHTLTLRIQIDEKTEAKS